MNRQIQFLLDELSSNDRFRSTVAAAESVWAETTGTPAFTRLDLASAHLAGDLESEFEADVPTLSHPHDSLLSFATDAIDWVAIASTVLQDVVADDDTPDGPSPPVTPPDATPGTKAPYKTWAMRFPPAQLRTF